MYCIRCGARLPSEANFCSACGTRAYTPESAVPQAPAQSSMRENESAQSQRFALQDSLESRTFDEAQKTCPSCGLLSPPSVLKCDCGYDFQSRMPLLRNTASRRLENLEILSVRSVFTVAFPAFTEAWSSVLIWTVVIVFVQLLTSVMISDDLLTRKAFQASDGVVIGLSLFIQSWIWYSILSNALSVVRGHQVQVLNSIVSPAMFLQILAVGLVALIPVALGSLLFLFPGVYLGLTWSQSVPLILDGRAHGLDSLKMSAHLTKGALGKIFVSLLMPAALILPARVLDRVAEHTNAFDGVIGEFVLVIGWLWQVLVGVFDVYVLVILYQILLNRSPERAERNPS